MKKETNSDMRILPIPILLIRPRLQLILIRSDRRRTPHPPQLALNIITDMFLVRRATAATGCAAGFLVVEEGRFRRGRGVACDDGVVVASVAD